MLTIPQVAAALQTVLTVAAQRAAQQTGCVQRQRRLTGPLLVQTLVLGWLGQPDATLERLAQTAAGLGVPITAQGLDQRFTPQAAACLEAVLTEAVSTALTADPVAIPVLHRFTAVVVEDSTTVPLPDALAALWPGTGERTGHNQGALKLQVRLDLLRGQLAGPVRQAGRASDRTSPLQREPLPPGALRVRDLGFFGLDDLAAQGARNVFWLTRLQVQTAVYDAAGQRWDLGALLAAQTAVAVDLPVQLGAQHRLPARLLAVRVPPAVAQERRRQLHAEAKRKGQAVSQARLALADWTVLVTNAPSDLLSLAEALVLYRVRWQIELVFKLWKQHGHLTTWRSRKPWRILCEVYAKLIGLVLQHWVVLASCWAAADRSLVKAAQTVRASVVLLVAALRGRLPLAVALEQLRATIAAGCRMNSRKTAPNTYQLLLRLTEAA